MKARRFAKLGLAAWIGALALTGCTAAVSSPAPSPSTSASAPSPTRTPTPTATSPSPSQKPTTAEPTTIEPSTTAPTTTAPPVAPLPPASSVDCTVEQCVALTFDDGPGPYTDKLLDELATRDVHATFFVVGKNIEARGKTVKREIAEGHVVGNHSWDHADLSKLSWQGVAQEIDSTNTALTNLGLPLPLLVRPPYGAQNPEVMAALKARGQIGTFWSIDTEDWKNRDVAQTTARALQARRGSILLMHDIQPTTVDAIPGIIDGLRQKGFTLVTVPELIGPHPETIIGMQMYSQYNVR